METYDRFFSDRANAMRASEIRELLKLTQKKDIISFAGGLPNPESFPIELIANICDNIFKTVGKQALQYGTTRGLPSLLDTFSSYFSSNGLKCTSDNLMVTSGSQQGLDLLSKVLINPGDTVVVGAPSYLGALGAFRVAQARFSSVELDNGGIKIDLLEDELAKLKREGRKTKFLYLVPDFQNPTGVTMSLEKRKRVIELAEEYDILVIEDDPYGRLRFEGEDVKRLYALDNGRGRVLYLSTLSKLLAPGFRVAVMMGHEELVKKMIVAKESTDLCSPTFTQFVAAEYVGDGHLDSHLVVIKDLYKKKRDLMLDALTRHMPDGVKWTHPEGGMFIWVTLPHEYSTTDIFPLAVEQNVAYVVGKAFYVNGGGERSMRLNFSYSTDEEIEEGIRRLAAVINASKPSTV